MKNKTKLGQELIAATKEALSYQKGKKNLKVHYSSQSDEWETPQWLFDKLNKMYGPFTLDAAATKSNTKCKDFLMEGLELDWYRPKYFVPRGSSITPEELADKCGLFSLIPENREIHEIPNTVWLNPPYSRGLQYKFVKKAFEESQKGCTVVCLLPARTDTKLFHEFVMKSSEVLFIKGRLKFSGAKNAAPFPSMVVVFRKGENNPKFGILNA